VHSAVPQEVLAESFWQEIQAIEEEKSMPYVTSIERLGIKQGMHRIDWAHFIKEMLDEHYADAEKVVLVMDNLNTHDTASLYMAFPPEEARRLANRLEIHDTPKHGSWLDIAEIELSVLKRQCLAGRIACIEKMRKEVAAWNIDRNNKQDKVDWQFKTKDARIKLKRLYPKLLDIQCTRDKLPSPGELLQLNKRLTNFRIHNKRF